MESINAFVQENAMCGISLTPLGCFEYTYPGAGVETTISGPILEAMPTKRLTFQDLWGYRKKTPTAASDLDLILDAAQKAGGDPAEDITPFTQNARIGKTCK